MRYAEEGRRLRLLRQTEGIATASAFAAHVGWPQSGVSQFETGKRRVTVDKALKLRAMIPGFDPLWLWEGEKRGLSVDLRRRIEAEEAKEKPAQDIGQASPP
jgi:transcriptional regulator with XRE-family HTH domain